MTLYEQSVGLRLLLLQQEELRSLLWPLGGRGIRVAVSFAASELRVSVPLLLSSVHFSVLASQRLFNDQ